MDHAQVSAAAHWVCERFVLRLALLPSQCGGMRQAERHRALLIGSESDASACAQCEPKSVRRDVWRFHCGKISESPTVDGKNPAPL